MTGSARDRVIGVAPGRVAVWQQEGRSEQWQRLARRLYGADAVDDHALSLTDAERLADAALDELAAPVSPGAPCQCCNGDPATVCDACGHHSCWAGEMMCEDAPFASTRQKVSPGATTPTEPDDEEVVHEAAARLAELLDGETEPRAAWMSLPKGDVRTVLAALAGCGAPSRTSVYPETWCGDVGGPNGVGGPCVLGAGHAHRDGIGGEWPT